jgi:hypothetical protein
MDDDAVVVTRVADEIEADVVCGLLRSAGLECGHRVTEETDSSLEGFTGTGPREVLVHADDLAAAKALLADVEG